MGYSYIDLSAVDAWLHANILDLQYQWTIIVFSVLLWPGSVRFKG